MRLVGSISPRDGSAGPIHVTPSHHNVCAGDKTFLPSTFWPTAQKLVRIKDALQRRFVINTADFLVSNTPWLRQCVAKARVLDAYRDASEGYGYLTQPSDYRQSTPVELPRSQRPFTNAVMCRIGLYPCMLCIQPLFLGDAGTHH